YKSDHENETKQPIKWNDPTLPASSRPWEDFSSDGADPDVRVERVEDDPGGWFGEEIGRFLRHHPARPRHLDYVGYRRGPQQEGGLGSSRLDPVEERLDIPGVTQIALLLHVPRLESQLTLEDLVMENRDVEPGDRIRRLAAFDVDGVPAAPTLPSHRGGGNLRGNSPRGGGVLREGDADPVACRGLPHRGQQCSPVGARSDAMAAGEPLDQE